MPFVSHLFILIFLPATLLLYYQVFKQYKSKVVFLFIASLIFYTASSWQYTILLLCVSLLTYMAGIKAGYLPGIILNLAVLFCFKYLEPGVSIFNQMLQVAGIIFVNDLLQLGLPLGVSFYVFRHIGYLLDVKAGRIPAENNVWPFLTFSFYFPQVSAGPLSSYRTISQQLSHLPARLETDQLAAALVYITYGFAKKVLIADQIYLVLISSEMSLPANFSGFIPAWYKLVAHVIQLYFDFSGYTDIALGVSMLFGISLPINFNNPYHAQNVRDFWYRWHISLSNWFRDYLFYPVSRFLLEKWGSSHRNVIQYSLNILTMSLIGLWHGASWGYLIWGLYHGILLNINTLCKQKNLHLPAAIGRIIFLISILLGWTIFISPNWSFFRSLFESLIGLNGTGFSFEILDKLWKHNASIALIAAICITCAGYTETASIIKEKPTQSIWQMFLYGILLALCLLGIQQGIDFAYIQF